MTPEGNKVVGHTRWTGMAGQDLVLANVSAPCTPRWVSFSSSNNILNGMKASDLVFIHSDSCAVYAVPDVVRSEYKPTCN